MTAHFACESVGFEMIQREQANLMEMLKESIQQRSTPSLTVISDSMSPLLRSGNHFRLQELDLFEAGVGQTIRFKNPSNGIQHEKVALPSFRTVHATEHYASQS